MFPQLWNETKDLAPEIFFGLAEVPPYQQIQLSRRSAIADVIDAILSSTWNSNSSGYIENGRVYFHGEMDEHVMVDLSKDFVFLSRPQLLAGAYPSRWQVLRFLQEPVRRALLIGQGSAMLLEKSPATFELCKQLDQVWATRIPIDDIVGVLEDETRRDGLLAGLMKTHESTCFGGSSEMWHFWDTFGLYLMVNRLGLDVTEIIPESDPS